MTRGGGGDYGRAFNFALYRATLGASYLLNSELEGKGDSESLVQLGKPAGILL